MKHEKTIALLVVLVAVVAVLATLTGILSTGGPGRYEYESIRGLAVTIYGTGVYRHMSADVAVQGIAQDYVTLFVGVPALLAAFLWARRGSLPGRFLLSGVLGYFLVTYLFYLAMAMYNVLFLAYAFLMGASFFAFILTQFSCDRAALQSAFRSPRLLSSAGLFLIVTAALIALMWLGIVVPPLLKGTVFPAAVQHYTTLIVQGFDLGLLLPLAMVTGVLALRGNAYGCQYAPVYAVFLALLMTALSAKIFFMAQTGVNVVPAVFIIPALNLIAVVFAVLLLRDARGGGRRAITQ